MSTAQIVFSIALGVMTLIITGFAVYVISTTLWGNRWIRPAKTDKSVSTQADEA